MGQYYYLVTGLPEISLDDSKLSFSVADFKKVIYPQLTLLDKKVADLFFLRYDNENVLKLLKNPEAATDDRGNFSAQTFTDIFNQLDRKAELEAEDNDKKVKVKFGPIPAYLKSFIESNYKKEEDDDPVLIEDRLAAAYYAHAMSCGNEFMRSWFEFNLNVSNIMIAVTARKHKMALANIIVGQTPVCEALRTSAQRDFGLSQELDYLDQVLKIADLDDLVERERKLDQLRWKWLEDRAFFEYFSVERLMTFLLETDMVERWLLLDKEKGNQMFRQIISDLKDEVKVPQEF